MVRENRHHYFDFHSHQNYGVIDRSVTHHASFAFDVAQYYIVTHMLLQTRLHRFYYSYYFRRRRHAPFFVPTGSNTYDDDHDVTTMVWMT